MILKHSASNKKYMWIGIQNNPSLQTPEDFSAPECPSVGRTLQYDTGTQNGVLITEVGSTWSHLIHYTTTLGHRISKLSHNSDVCNREDPM